MAWLTEHPGMLYVVATLLPLASFTLLLLVGAVRRYLRSQRQLGFAARAYAALGGDTPGRGAAYVATGAMGLAFVLSVIGFVLFVNDFGTGKGEHPKDDEPVAEVHAVDPHRWGGEMTWLQVS